MWKTTRQLAARRVPWRLSESILPPLQAGRWYGPSNEVAQTTLALTVNRLYGMPICIPVTAFTEAIASRVTTLAGGTNIRLGLYADGGGVPGALLADAGVVSGAVADEAALAMVKWLRAGWYWLACLSDGTPTLRAVSNGGPSLLGMATNIETDIHNHVYAAQAYGALPDPFPAPTYGSTGASPRIMLAGLSGMEEVSDGWRITQDVEMGTLLHPPHVAGRYYGSPLIAAVYPTRTLALVAATMYAMPFLAGATRTYDRISIHVTTAVAGKSCQLGIYADSAGVPGALVLDAGNVSAATTGGKEINIAQSLPRGWYWLACVSDGTPTLRTYQGSNKFGWLGRTSGIDTNFYGGMSVAQAYGALPNPFTAGAVLASVPRILLRAA